MKTPVSKPIAVTLPARGVAFAESVHGPRFRMTERADPFHKLIYVLQGKIAFTATSAAKPLHAAAGTTLCVRAGVAHRIADAAPPTLLLLCFAPEFLADDPARARLWAQLTGGQGAVRRPGGPGSPRFEGLWRAGIAEQAGSQPGREVALRAAADNILVALARVPPDTPADPTNLRVAAVARELTGRTFLEQLTELRLTHAATLLRDNRHSIIGAAFSSGYGDLSHFYRLFRARFGQPPRAWLEKRRGMVLRP